MNELIKSISVLKFALGALAGVLVLNFILRVLFKFEGVPVTIAIAAAMAALLAGWFAKSAGRSPTPQERSRLLWLYGGMLALLFVALVLLVSLKHTPNLAGLVILFIHYLPYPAFAQMFFSEKYFTKFVKK